MTLPNKFKFKTVFDNKNIYTAQSHGNDYKVSWGSPNGSSSAIISNKGVSDNVRDGIWIIQEDKVVAVDVPTSNESIDIGEFVEKTGYDVAITGKHSYEIYAFNTSFKVKGFDSLVKIVKALEALHEANK